MLCTKIVLDARKNFCTHHVLPRFELGIFMYWTCNSMSNLSSYCGLVDAKIRVSNKDLPVSPTFDSFDMESKSLKFDSNNIFSSFIKSLNLTDLSEVCFLF